MRKRLLSFYISLFIVTSLYSQNVGIGTPTPGSRLEVVGSETTSHGKNAAITIINTASSREWNLRAGATGTGTPKNGFSIADNLAYRFVIDSTGQIGIGELNPIAPLSIRNGFYGNKIALYGYNADHFGLGVSSSSLLQIYTDNNSSDIAFGYGNSNNFTERMRVKGNGNVGIGTTTPLQKLDINGNVCLNNNAIYLRVGNDLTNGLKYSASVNGPYLFGNSGGSLGVINYTDALRWDLLGNVVVTRSMVVDTARINNGDLNSALLFGGWTGEGIGSKRTAGGNQNGLDFYTNGTNRLAITSNGNIGIGTTNPLQKLDVQGNASFNSNAIYLRAGNDLAHGLQYKASVDGPYLFGYLGGGLGTANNPDALRWDYLGQVAVRSSLFVDTADRNNGTLAEALRFGISSGEGIGSKRTVGGNQYGLDFYTGFTNRIAITGGGNVGIGTTTPTSKLEVNGETKTASLKVGNNGTSLSIVQKGTFTIGTSSGAFKQVTFNFPSAFTSTPVLVVTVKSSGSNFDDTFVATIRSISTTSVTINILRVDTAAGWAQNLLLDWIAVQ